ncbi:hypothetical protein BHM03_00003064, partial [Ensete ventricosum]
KTEAKMATARIKLLRNKREAQVRQMRRDVAMLLESGRDETARIRVRTLRSHPPYSFLLLLVLRSGLWDRILRVPYGSEIWGFASLVRDIFLLLFFHRPNNNREGSILQFNDPVLAAQAAAESAEKAIQAAQAAAHLANQNSHPFDRPMQMDPLICNLNKFNQPERLQRQSLGFCQPYGTKDISENEVKPPGKFFNSQSFNCSNNMDDESMDTVTLDEKRILRRNSCTARTAHSAIKFDDSDGLESDTDEEFEMESPPLESHPPPSRPPPVLHSQQVHSEESYADSHQESSNKNSGSHVHPKLPDYEALTARFEALKSRRI